MPVDYLPLILLIVILACAIGAFRVKPAPDRRPTARAICLVTMSVSVAVLFFIYLYPGIRLFPKASGGDAMSQFELGKWYQAGMNTGLFELPGKAVKWFRKAADQGHAASQYQMGIYYSQGIGVGRNYAAAIGWFEKAATNGMPEAAERSAWFRRETQGKN